MMIDTPDDIPHSSVKTNSPPNPLDSREAAEKAAEDASREKFLEAFAEYHAGRQKPFVVRGMASRI